MFLAAAAALILIALALTFFVRPQPLTESAGASPWRHLEGRKASIYENLRDLQFEYRLGKLSDEDYQRTKIELQAELAGILAEIDRLKAEPAPSSKAEVKAAANVCPHCKAKFPKPLKFCGECGKSMGAPA